MKRRSAIKNLMIIAGGIAIFPSCSNDPAKASIQLTNLNINADQEALLAEIAETIIPKTSTAPGARDLNLHLFTMKMVDDCYSTEEQQLFVSGLNGTDLLAKEKYNHVFIKCSTQQKNELLTLAMKDENAPKELATFLRITKQKLIQGFTNSKYVMTDLKQYEMVPGRYNGYFPADKV